MFIKLHEFQKVRLQLPIFLLLTNDHVQPWKSVHIKLNFPVPEIVLKIYACCFRINEITSILMQVVTEIGSEIYKGMMESDA